eukprot:gnl/MRDRNA2_/MRDRNA2_86760_c0_seq1.p1 gnl/MRDRNA2_/MRDRNA2_86760_c0~~gnl/MRDRNA2_/MRDRNA2_86760_c0_seq1.p1  ORF type:complete len:495 (+),score=111.63 gnl/MRDRNA2_/MRDRNA2_86760_c0_seq1:107-1591(+)
MMYRLLGATAVVMGVSGQDVAGLKNELANMKSELAGSGHSQHNTQKRRTEDKDDRKYPKDMYQDSASQKGDYQKYMDKYGKSGNYTQYMQKYQHDYQNYLTKYAGKNDGDYQQYMDKYTENGGSQGDYQQYYSQYMDKYAQNSGYQKYADYQMYIQRYSHHLDQEEDTVRNANDAKTVKQLNQWRDVSKQNVAWYTPAAYSKYADNDIEKKYNTRLMNLTGGSGGSANPFDDAINLDEVTSGVEHASNQLLQKTAEAGIDMAEKMSDNLKRANADSAGIELAAAVPSRNVAGVYSGHSEKLGQNIRNLQDQAKSKKSMRGDLSNQVRKSMSEAKQLQDDQVHALNRAHQDARAAVGHAARGAQTEVRKQARQVRMSLHTLARKDRTHQAHAEMLQKRMETAANSAEDQAQELAHKMKQHLDANLVSARKEVYDQAQRRSNDLQEALSLLAASDETDMTTGALGLFALASFAITLVALFAKRPARIIQPHGNMLG